MQGIIRQDKKHRTRNTEQETQNKTRQDRTFSDLRTDQVSWSTSCVQGGKLLTPKISYVSLLASENNFGQYCNSLFSAAASGLSSKENFCR